jgi:hypothetical protein
VERRLTLDIQKSNLAGHWAVSVSGNWRLTFSFSGISVADFAKKLKVSRVALSRVLNCRAAISAELAIEGSRLALKVASPN